MIGFDDLTLGEVEEMVTVALKGKGLQESDPLMAAGGIMWMAARRDNPSLSWEDFKRTTNMRDIKAFALDMEAADTLNPTNVVNALPS